jgi:hypothetical protein
MKKTIDYINREIKFVKRAKLKPVKGDKYKSRLFKLRNIACEALKDFIMNEYEGVK